MSLCGIARDHNKLREVFNEVQYYGNEINEDSLISIPGKGEQAVVIIPYKDETKKELLIFKKILSSWILTDRALINCNVKSIFLSNNEKTMTVSCLLNGENVVVKFEQINGKWVKFDSFIDRRNRQ